jgi:DNA-binding GntR family transcriptional regulator
LREALSRLAAEGLVVSAPVSIADLQDLTNIRVLIEREALRLSIVNGDDQWEAGILSTFYRMDRLQVRLGEHYYLQEEWIQIHSEFHLALVKACQSPNLLQIRKELFGRAHRYRQMSSQFRARWRPKHVEHKMIMDATLDRDEVLALSLIERHIRETTENVIEHAGHLFEPASGSVQPK